MILYHRALRRSLVLGAIYDLALGLFILILGRTVMAALGHPVASSFLFLLGTLPLLLLPALYFAAARAEDVEPFRGPVLWARGAGGLLVLALTFAFRPPVAWIYAAIGAADLVWAAVHLALWRRP